MVLLQRPHPSAKSLDAELHGAATIKMVGRVQALHERVTAGIIRFLSHQQQVTLHMTALTKVKQHHAGLAVGHAGLVNAMIQGSVLSMCRSTDEVLDVLGALRQGMG